MSEGGSTIIKGEGWGGVDSGLAKMSCENFSGNVTRLIKTFVTSRKGWGRGRINYTKFEREI
jgi:hypothetical protein